MSYSSRLEIPVSSVAAARNPEGLTGGTSENQTVASISCRILRIWVLFLGLLTAGQTAEAQIGGGVAPGTLPGTRPGNLPGTSIGTLPGSAVGGLGTGKMSPLSPGAAPLTTESSSTTSGLRVPTPGTSGLLGSGTEASDPFYSTPGNILPYTPPRSGGITREMRAKWLQEQNERKQREEFEQEQRAEEERRLYEANRKRQDIAAEILESMRVHSSGEDSEDPEHSSPHRLNSPLNDPTGKSVPVEIESPPGSGAVHLHAPVTNANAPLTEAQRKRQEKIEKARELYRQQREQAMQAANFFSGTPIAETLLREGWCRLFDGKTLFGWRVQNTPGSPYANGRFVVQDGLLVNDPAHPGLIYTTSQFGDLTVSFEYTCSQDAEALLLLHTSPDPRDLHTSCYTVVLHSKTRQRGIILGRQEENIVRPVTEEPGPDAARDPETGGIWRRCTALCGRGQVKVIYDKEEPVVYYDVTPLGRGYIGFLAAKGLVKFRNIQWCPGASVSLFNGIDLSGWRFNPEPPLPVPLKDQDMSLQVQGPTILETRGLYKDFTLSLEYNMVYADGNAGFFFRATPREAMTGYDCVIRNFPTPEERRHGKGNDVGSLRGLIDARFVNPQDQRWNTLTLNVVDRHIQTWVNGIPVCDWGDLRPLDPSHTEPMKEGENRTGPFPDAGTIQLYALTENTLIIFRNIMLSPVNVRSGEVKSPGMTWSEMTDERRRREAEEKKEELPAPKLPSKPGKADD